MKKACSLLLFLLWLCPKSDAQSLEFMAGDKGIFVDAQWLKFMDSKYRWSLFSRTRATVNYENQTDLFTGAYLNYTTKPGIGASIVGKIGSAGAGGDAGIHIFKAKENWTLFGLAAVGLKKQLEYSWFSIFRFTPKIGENWKLYTSLELFFLFRQGQHLFSVQRFRIGLDWKGFQFGIANNLAELGSEFTTKNNFGGFIRKSF